MDNEAAFQTFGESERPVASLSVFDEIYTVRQCLEEMTFVLLQHKNRSYKTFLSHFLNQLSEGELIG